MAIFRDREDAGRTLAHRLMPYAGRSDVVVLGLPRGGVPVAFQVAQALNLALDIYLVRKLGVPGQAELAMGAIASGGVRLLNEDVVRGLGIPEYEIEAVASEEAQELGRRERLYRGDRPPLPIEGRTVILVDDGLATGASMRAAVAGVRARKAARIVVAVPVAPPETCEQLCAEVDDIVCAITPEPFNGVGLWYDDFSQTSDDEVRRLLHRAASAGPGSFLLLPAP